MSLADRSYLREEYNPPRVTNYLLIGLLVAFFVQCLVWFYGGWDARNHLGLTLDGIRHWKLWQLITYQFLHAAPWPWHVLFNCLGLYFFGRPVEETLGSRKFISLYALAGISGGLLHLLVTWVLPHHLDGGVVGASAGVCGLIAIYCSLYPMRELTTFIYFFPVTIRARYFLWFIGGLSVFGTFIPFDNVAHAAHLGGIVLGIGYVRWFHETEVWAEIRSRFRRRPRTQVKVRFPRAPSNQAAAAAEARKETAARATGPTEFISREVDPILDKIASKGIHSLTDEEKQVLEKARSRIEKR